MLRTAGFGLGRNYNKDYLLFARILAMMADEHPVSISDYDRYHKYVKPAVEAYDLVIFDVGYYKIICSSISVEKVERL